MCPALFCRKPSGKLTFPDYTQKRSIFVATKVHWRLPRTIDSAQCHFRIAYKEYTDLVCFRKDALLFPYIHLGNPTVRPNKNRFVVLYRVRLGCCGALGVLVRVRASSHEHSARARSLSSSSLSNANWRMACTKSFECRVARGGLW